MYISKNGTLGYWKENMEKFITGQKLELIIGNFNYCYQTIPQNQTRIYLEATNLLN